MKRTKLLLQIVLLYCLCSQSCMEDWDMDMTGIPKEEELVRYPYMRPFLAEMYDFRGVVLNTDNGYYCITFKSKLKTPREFFETVKAQAEQAGWSVVYASKNRHVYRGKASCIPSAPADDIVVLTFDNRQGRIVLEVNPVPGPLEGVFGCSPNWEVRGNESRVHRDPNEL